ncbi:MAG: hypothetical protein IPN57_09525 [Ignavibacteria bacterium]|nr:hypothetical protein [Ignavibacteria bacterium]
MESTVLIITILSGATTILISIVGYFIIRLIRVNDENQKAVSDFQVKATKEMNDIKFNYLDRFDRIKDQIMESEVRIISNIAGKFRHLKDDK